MSSPGSTSFEFESSSVSRKRPNRADSTASSSTVASKRARSSRESSIPAAGDEAFASLGNGAPVQLTEKHLQHEQAMASLRANLAARSQLLACSTDAPVVALPAGRKRKVMPKRTPKASTAAAATAPVAGKKQSKAALVNLLDAEGSCWSAPTGLDLLLNAASQSAPMAVQV